MVKQFIRDVRFFFTPLWWRFTWVWIRYGGFLHRCGCCNAYNRSVGYWWPIKALKWMCNECVYACNGRCNGTPFRKLERMKR